MHAPHRNTRSLNALRRSALTLAIGGALLLAAPAAFAQAIGGSGTADACKQDAKAEKNLACGEGSQSGPNGGSSSGGQGGAGGEGNVALGIFSLAGQGGLAVGGQTGGIGGNYNLAFGP
ncbi:hypothetical protein MASR1M8_04290 [Thermomonas brevis]